MSIEGKMSTKKTKNKNRRPSININCGQGLVVSVSFDPDTGEPYDVFLVGRGYKASDVQLNQALYEAWVNISKIMKGKDV